MNSYCLIGIYLLIIAGIFGIARCFKTYKIDAKPLTQQTLFWLAIVIPIVSFIYFGLFAWWGKTPVLSAHGFERFIKISTLPLGLLSLAIPFTAVINNIHRTVQTNEQINQTKKKNEFDLFYSHRKNFIECVQAREFSTFILIMKNNIIDGKVKETVYNIKTELVSSYSLYKIVYQTGHSINGEIPNVSETFLKDVNYAWERINTSLTNLLNIKISDTTFDKFKSEFIKLQNGIDILHETLNLRLISPQYNIEIYNSSGFKSYIINNDFLRFLLSSTYTFTLDIYNFINHDIFIFSNDILSIKPTIVHYINNQSINLDFANPNKDTKLFDGNGNYKGFI